MRSFWRRSRLRLRTLTRMSWSDKALAAESLVMLAAARAFVRFTPGKSVISRIGGVSPETSDGGSQEPAARGEAGEAGEAAGVGKMLERVSRSTWWRSMCLEKALAGRWMLRRRGIASTMYIGMARKGQEFIAHAWLVGDGQTITGAGEITYATLAVFRESGPGQPDPGLTSR